NPTEGAAPGGTAAPTQSGAAGQAAAGQGAAGQGALLSPGGTAATQAPAPVFVSRPTTVIRTAPNEIVVPLRRPEAPAAADEPVDPSPKR
ncbi:MAG: hypothetical protein DCC72_12515, partial [Burkholderiales bacterium]